MLEQEHLNRNTKMIEPSNAIPSILAANYGKYTKIIFRLFAEKPKEFGMYAESLLYTLYAGKSLKPEYVHTIIESQ